MTANLPEIKPEIQNINQQVEQPKAEEPKPIDQQQQQEDGDPNWRAFREARKKDRAEREAAEKRAAEKDAEVSALKAAMEAAFAKNTYAPQSFYGQEHTDEETEDQRIEKKVNALLAQREAQMARERQENEMREYPNRLMKDFPDFNHIISQEHRDYLDYHYPEISRPLSRLPDGYDKWHDIYLAIKKLVPNLNAKKDSAKVDANMMKPKSISSPGLTQPQSVPGGNILSEERKQANWERMQKMLKGIS